mmetsp:Transcript_24613/g.44668  ORF Transcript_24613/g.44668 Transcript_24613/m.44668 type:complete len:81 (+) Transcript_24613:610-852(+)
MQSMVRHPCHPFWLLKSHSPQLLHSQGMQCNMPWSVALQVVTHQKNSTKKPKMKNVRQITDRYQVMIHEMGYMVLVGHNS